MDNLYQNGEVLHQQSMALQREYLKLKEIMEQCSKIVSQMTRDTGQLKIKSSLNILGNTQLLNIPSVGGRNQDMAGVLKLSKMLFSVLGARASGGNVSAGVPYLVGERGAEMFVPNSSGNIVANHALSKHAPINITMNITTPDVSGFTRSRSQIIAELSKAMQRR